MLLALELLGLIKVLAPGLAAVYKSIEDARKQYPEMTGEQLAAFIQVSAAANIRADDAGIAEIKADQAAHPVVPK